MGEFGKCLNSVSVMNEPTFKMGDKVHLVIQPPYFKTAEPMPMLRPPDLVRVGEEGIVRDRRPGGYWVVQFSRGSFLMDAQYLQAIAEEGASPSPEEE